MGNVKRWVLASGAAPWILLFLLVNLAFPLPGGTNSDSRYFLLNAWAEDHSSRIDAYHTKTGDWARAPDGHYYSNKAPGPSLLAFPFYWLIDKAGTASLPDRAARDEFRYRYKARVQKILAFLLQLLPFAWLLAAAGHFLRRRGASSLARDLSLFALAFGSTASLFMNTFFGHGVTAVSLFAFALAALEGQAFLAGLALGLAVLSDYGSIALLPAAALAFFPAFKNRLSAFFLGAAGPAFAWVAYHQSAFGSPFTLASRYQNPEYVDSVASHPLWGILSLPNVETVRHLIVGPERGLLWTQPWILLLVPVAAVLILGPPSEKKKLASLSLLGLMGLVLMNASFNGWHGGLTPGPRYLSAIFPVWALLLGLVWDGTSEGRKRGLSAALMVSGALAVLVFSTSLSVPLTPLWPCLSRQLFQTTETPKFRFAALLILIALSLLWRKRGERLGWKPWNATSSESA